jgi:ABC-type multidrug transport system ATPase subunit
MMKALSIKALRKTYGGGVEALKGIDLQVEAGDFYALLGPNGAGKSTTIGIISSLVNKSSGSVEVFGFDLDKQLEQAKAQIGLVPQEFNFSQFEKVEQILVNQAGFYGVPRTLAYLCLGLLQLFIQIESEHLDTAAAHVNQGADDADGGGLTCAVRPEQRIKIALFDD